MTRQPYSTRRLNDAFVVNDCFPSFGAHGLSVPADATAISVEDRRVGYSACDVLTVNVECDSHDGDK